LEQYQATRDKGYISLPLGNHDLARLNVQRTPEELEALIAFGVTMPGVPFLYYGNEIGMRQLHDLPQIEGCYKPRAGARTPMQWTAGPNRGFSTAEASRLWLPVDPADDAPNVESQERDPDSLLNRVRALVRLKHQEPALAGYADFLPLYAEDSAYPLVFARVNGKEALLAVFNPAARAATAEFPCPLAFRATQLLAGRDVTLRRKGQQLTLTAPGQSYAVYGLDE
jgi:maltose alpha-D-glucosyltransferase/alpha-amylase